MDLFQLNKIAIKAALSAGKIIQHYTKEDVSVEQKKGGTSYASQVVTVVDRACEAAILAHLLPTCEAFDLGLLSEETEDDASRFEKDFFWCIDPMDGTLAFINKQPGFSVSIALIRTPTFLCSVWTSQSSTCLRVVSLSFGATASSRSMQTISAPAAQAFSKRSGRFPGTNNCDL